MPLGTFFGPLRGSATPRFPGSGRSVGTPAVGGFSRSVRVGSRTGLAGSSALTGRTGPARRLDRQSPSQPVRQPTEQVHRDDDLGRRGRADLLQRLEVLKLHGVSIETSSDDEDRIQCCRQSLGAENGGLPFAFGGEDRRLLRAFGQCDRRLLLALCLGDRGPPWCARPTSGASSLRGHRQAGLLRGPRRWSLSRPSARSPRRGGREARRSSLRASTARRRAACRRQRCEAWWRRRSVRRRRSSGPGARSSRGRRPCRR